MNERKLNLKGYRNLVTVDDFKNEISVVEYILKSATGIFRNQMIRYKNKLQKELAIYCRLRESV